MRRFFKASPPRISTRVAQASPGDSETPSKGESRPSFLYSIPLSPSINMGCGSSSPANSDASAPPTILVAEKRPKAAEPPGPAAIKKMPDSPKLVTVAPKVTPNLPQQTESTQTSSAPAAVGKENSSPSAVATAAPAAELAKKFPKPSRRTKSAAPTSVEYSISDVNSHNSPSSSWTVYRGFVYDITDFMDSHPGGEGLLRRQAMGKDCTEEFDNYLHSESAFHMLRTMLIGKLVNPPVYKPNALGQYSIKAGLPSSQPEDEKPPPISDTHQRYTENKSNHSKADSSTHTKTGENAGESKKSTHGEAKGREATGNGQDSTILTAASGLNSLMAPLPGVPSEPSGVSMAREESVRMLEFVSASPFQPGTPVKENPPVASLAAPLRSDSPAPGADGGAPSFIRAQSASTDHRPRTVERKSSAGESPMISAVSACPGNRHSSSHHLSMDRLIYKFELVESVVVTPDVCRLKFHQVAIVNSGASDSAEKTKFHSAPGQSILVRVPVEALKPFLLPDAAIPPAAAPIDSEPPCYQRPYTLIGSEPGTVELLIKQYSTGSISRFMCSLKVGDFLTTTGPRGRFHFDEYYGHFEGSPEEAKKAEEPTAQANSIITTMQQTIKPSQPQYQHWLFICGGTGITPFLRVLNEVFRRSAAALAENPNSRPPSILLIDCNRSPDDVLLKEEIIALSETHDNFRILHLLPRSRKSSTVPVGAAALPTGEVFDRSSLQSLSKNRSSVGFSRLDTEMLRKFIDPQGRSLALLCGPDGLVTSATKALDSLGFQRGCGTAKDMFIF